MVDAAITVVPSVLAYGAVWGRLARQAGLSFGESLGRVPGGVVKCRS